MNRARAEQKQVRSTLESETRHARILSELETKEQVLQSVLAFFASSSSVEPHEFISFSEGFLADGHVVAVCWVSSFANARFSVVSPTLTSHDPCRKLDFLTLSGVVETEPPLVFISGFAATENQKQRGLASVVFDMRFLFLEDQALSVEEFLVINDRSQNIVQSFQFSDLNRFNRTELGLGSESAYRYLELARFETVDFVYLTLPKQDVGSALGPNDLLFPALVSLGLIAGLYIRSLIRSKEVIALEVRHRTDELRQFAYRTSHDLKAPLVTVAGLCRIVEEDIDEKAFGELRSNIGRIAAHVNKLSALVEDILALAKADLAVEAAETIDFQQICKEVFEHTNLTFAGHTIQTSYTVATRGEYRFPRARILQILENLVSNSIKYADLSKSRSFVEISIDDSGESLEIIVSDNGLGIPEEFQKRVFNMFERFHPDISQVGSGLGMSIVKKHVERLGGSIAVSSSQLGTEIAISLAKPKESTA